jgi:hypothetical protein
MLQGAKDVCLAAADDVTRQRCLRIIEAACIEAASSLSVKCKRGHECLPHTYKFSKSIQQYGCDLRHVAKFSATCKKLFDDGDAGFKCHSCGYDICMACYGAIASGASSSPPDIAASVALTRGLLDMKSVAAVKAVLAALGIPLDHPSLKAVGFDPSSLTVEMKRVGVTATQFKDAGWSLANLIGHAFSISELQAAGFNVAELYTIVFVDSNPATLAQAQLYYRDVEFASQLCSEFAAAERSNAQLYSRLSQAHEALQLIVDHNPLLRSPPSGRQPAWPRHEALLRFDLPLQRLTSQFLVTKKWTSRFYVLRGSRLYYSNGKSGHPDSLEGSLAFMRSNPAPDGHCCLDLKGACARCTTAVFCCASQSLLDAGCSVVPCSAAVDGQAFAFEIKFPAGPKVHACFYSM